MPDTGPAKVSPLGPEYHYHETDDGPDVNTTDSAIDNGPHDHGIAISYNMAIDTNKTTGPQHTHHYKGTLLTPAPSKPPVIRPGLGDRNKVLEEQIVEAIKMVIRTTNEMHLSAIFHKDTRHDGRSWRRCKSWVCCDALAYVARMSELYPLNHNPHALRQYRRGLRQVQISIRSSAKLEQVVREFERKPEL